MKKISLFAATFSVAAITFVQAGPYADAVIAYSPGTGSSSGFNTANTVLGMPSTINPFTEAVDPFNSPYGNLQIVSLGAGGSLTVQFLTPIQNNPANPYGLDFLIFGNTGFVVTNATDVTFNYIGTPATDGSTYGHNTGATRVSVSADGVTYFQLNPSLAPVVDGLHPTDGAGNFGRPVNPALRNAAFAGKDMNGIRSLYAGSGGGTGFDIAWAQDANSLPVNLASIGFVRVDVVSGKSEIDAFSAVSPVPEPTTWGLGILGALIGFVARRKR